MSAELITTEVITNGEFETGDFSGWFYDTIGNAVIFINDGLSEPDIDPIYGNYDALMSANEGRAAIIQLSASLPAGIVEATFSWSDRIFNYHDDFVTGTGGFPPTDGQELAVFIGSFEEPIFRTNPGDDLVQFGPNNRSYDVTEDAQSSSGSEVPILFLLTGTYDAIVCMIDNVSLQVEYTLVDVDVDIKPGSDPNCFNNDGHGVIPVAILGSAEFDVTTIDAGSVMLEGLAVKAVGKSNKLLAHYEDVNSDGYDDLVVQIEDNDLVFEEGDTLATVRGYLKDGTATIEGSDSICIVPPA